jgi:hypothetical protein
MAKADLIPFLDPEGSIFVNAALILGTRLNEMLAYEDCLLDPTRVYELHQMRIAAKRLRYTLEIFQKVYADHTRFGKEMADAIEKVKALQEHLGEIHDADVLAPQLTAHLARLLKPGYEADRGNAPVVGVHLVDFDACQGLLTLCRETRAARDKRYQLLLREWEKLREGRFFAQLRALLRNAISETTVEAVLEGSPAATTSPHATAGKENTAHGETLADATTDPRPPTRRGGRQRTPATNGRAAHARRHPRTGPDSDSGAAEGGAE